MQGVFGNPDDQPQLRGRSEGAGALPEHLCSNRPPGCPELEPGPQGHHQDVSPTKLRVLTSRLVDGAGTIKITKDGKVLLSEMVS